MKHDNDSGYWYRECVSARAKMLEYAAEIRALRNALQLEKATADQAIAFHADLKAKYGRLMRRVEDAVHALEG